MILRIQILKSDLAHMKSTLSPENIETQDLVNLFRDWGFDMALASTLFYQEGARRYYWKNRETGLLGWDDHYELEG